MEKNDNPCRSDETTTKSVGQLFADCGYLRPKLRGKGGGTHGELLRYFCLKLNPSRVASGYDPLTEKGIQATLSRGYLTTTRDLFWLKSVCEDAERRGYSFSKRFWWYAKLTAQERAALPI